ncbi:NAD-dependent 4,6-dehydratase LegB [Sulfurihydrogenibium yellowstonense]|uniref:NAD-dependent epimerase/dehydratase n=1 Tax=Sulfurihydrogenibium yellowstonense SS-5 TaxID=432331 RepID=C4FIE2_9AQUI|nr:NAD-dependent 4,6-dehydratase LegB [Sulfurihydrogenibium yellowstonense]EEP61160.1 NAD-dependent epimerase/dehydratase [Sulfurihydrogenibium yellowstonense SS-5]
MELKNKRVLVTGSGGFIGSHLVERLLEEGCEVVAFVKYNSLNKWGWLDSFDKKVLDKIEIFTGDIRNSDSVRKAVKSVDVVFHLAALISIPYSYISPESYVETNINGTLNILQACMDYSIEKVLITSTSEVYGTAKFVPITEDHPKQGQSPYSATKIAADYLAESFYRSFDLPVVIVRPFNTYGPRQSARAVIPTIITQLLSGYEEIKLGSLHPTRDLVYVKDTVEGFVRLAECDSAIGKEVNIATQSEISIQDLAKKLINKINPNAKIVSEDVRIRPQNSEVERLLGSNEKLKELTGWIPETDIDRGLELTIEWFKNEENLRIYKPWVYNV